MTHFQIISPRGYCYEGSVKKEVHLFSGNRIEEEYEPIRQGCSKTYSAKRDIDSGIPQRPTCCTEAERRCPMGVMDSKHGFLIVPEAQCAPGNS